MRKSSITFKAGRIVWMMSLASAVIFAPGVRAQNPPTGSTSVEVRGAGVPGSIRGVVFDSLLMKPLPGATVMLLGRVESTKSDSRGRFHFDDVTPGRQTVMFTAPELDSLGLGVMGADVTVLENAPVNMSLTTPSLRTLWQRRCAGVVPTNPDSGIVWGTIRSATTGAPLSDAIAALSWFALRDGNKRGLQIDDIKLDAITDPTGFFFACGVPTGFVIATTGMDTSAARGKAASGSVEYVVGTRRLQMLDLLVSSDMVGPDPLPTSATAADSAAALAAADSAALSRPRGRATLKGTVTGDDKRPVADAIVAVPAADTSVRTDKDGAFVLGGLPAGTHTVQTRRVGYAAISQLVSLRADSITDIRIFSSVNVLATVNVRATVKKGADRSDYELRRRQGFGYFAEGKQLERQFDVEGVLRMFPSLRVERKGFELVATLPGSMSGRCKPNIYLDGMPSDIDFVSRFRPTDFRAIEAFTRGITAPIQYTTFAGCGVLLFWTRAGANW